MNITTCLAAALLALLAGAAPAWADDGHGGAASAPAGTALPRFAAVSDNFELVGVANGRALTLYLDRFADNRPVEGATLTLKLGDETLAVTPHGPGEYEATLAAALTPGERDVIATVQSGDLHETLTGELHLEAAAHAEAAHTHSPREWLLWAAGFGALLLALAFVMRRSAARRRALNVSTPGAAA
ncbi:MAG: hypothetical protein EOP73_23515 [Variovorax sp.]|nr:MAG: hypothetical protein EOP73_23515 [Variovorax sp.]